MRNKMPIVSKQRAKSITKKRSSSKTSSIFDTLKECNEDEGGLKLHLYGRSGTGKTTLWSSFPGPILAIICSGGRKPGELKSVPLDKRSEIKKHVVTESSQIGELIREQQKTGRFETVVLDHLTGLQELLIAEILGLDEIPVQMAWGMAKIQDYGQRSIQMKRILMDVMSLDCNVVTIAQETDSSEESSNNDSEIIQPYIDSAMSKSVRAWFNPSADYIAQTFKRPRMTETKKRVGSKTVTKTVKGKGVEYCLRVGDDGVSTVKFRIPGGHSEDVIVNPSYDKIMSLINGE
jgi:hypothetical protein